MLFAFTPRIYLQTLLHIANEKFAINTNHMTKFYKAIEDFFQQPKANTARYVSKKDKIVVEVKEKKEKNEGLEVEDFGNDFSHLVGGDLDEK